MPLSAWTVIYDNVKFEYGLESKVRAPVKSELGFTSGVKGLCGAANYAKPPSSRANVSNGGGGWNAVKTVTLVKLVTSSSL